MVNFGPLAAEIGPVVWGTPANFNGFRVLAALLHRTQQWASGKLCGVEQRAPPIFGKADITLGIDPHSSIMIFCKLFGWLHLPYVPSFISLRQNLTNLCEFNCNNLRF